MTALSAIAEKLHSRSESCISRASCKTQRLFAPRRSAGDDIEARGQRLPAAAMAATAFQKDLGAVHSVSHPIGAIYGVHNGLTNGVVMPHVLAFNAPNIGDKMQRLAAYIGWIDGKSSGASAVRAINDWILQLRSEIGISATIADIGVEKEKFADIARLAVVDPTAGTNPVPLN
ncbi:MAG: iron-containing alcohol dehydrogenase [Proteobacteria bacterium]|nr:iron-containing alcohol dehydrogenase [Pseudomonadota bacterium]